MGGGRARAGAVRGGLDRLIGGRDVQSGRPSLGFLGSSTFCRENPSFWGLEKLGFPWILSSEMSLFNGLRGIFVEIIFLRPFALGAAPERGTWRSKS